jgi:hypothetical protein
MGPAIKRSRDLLHPLGHYRIANAHLPQGRIHVPEERIGQILPNLVGRMRQAAQGAQRQDHMKGESLEPPLQSIRDAKCRIKPRGTRSRSDPLVESRNGCTPRILAEETEDHSPCPSKLVKIVASGYAITIRRRKLVRAAFLEEPYDASISYSFGAPGYRYLSRLVRGRLHHG